MNPHSLCQTKANKQLQGDVDKLSELKVANEKLKEQMEKLKAQTEVERNKLVAEITVRLCPNI